MDCKLDVSDSNVRVDRAVVFCHDWRRLFDRVMQVREFHSLTEVDITFGVDAGKSFLKFSVTIRKRINDLSSPGAKLFKRSSYQDGPVGANAKKDGGVDKVILLAIVQNAKETYHNLKTIMDLFTIHSYNSSSKI